MARHPSPGRMTILHRVLEFVVVCAECGDRFYTKAYDDDDRGGARKAAVAEVRARGDWKYSPGRGWFCPGCEWSRKGTA